MATIPQLVLLVDDHGDSRVVLRAILEYEGRRVLEAANGLDCVSLAREHHPDVIVLDLRMPVMDGWQAASILKADPLTAGIPIVAVTASAFLDDSDNALQLGCSCVLVKPVAPKELVRRVDEAFAASAGATVSAAASPA